MSLRGGCTSRRHLRRTAFVAVQVSNLQSVGDCFAKCARNDGSYPNLPVT